MIDLVVSPVAERDLEELWLALATENEHNATRLLHEIGDKIQWLRRFPRLGPRRRDIRPSVRMLVQAPYLILYETRPDHDEAVIDAVEIVRVVDGRRDPNRYLTP